MFERWLSSVQQHGVKMGLERVRGALEILDEPQRRFPSILVAGTNGKGSTVAFASALLKAAGHRVGSTYSPHLVDYRERFRVDGRLIGPEELQEVGGRLHTRLAHRPELAELTFFELGTLVAAAWFAEQEVDAAVFEVGMGGEFDASRAADSDVLVLTTVDLDHQAFLGDSVAEIAGTKARAVIEGGAIVSTEVRPDRLPAIEAAAGQARLILAGRDFRWSFEQGLNFELGAFRMDEVSLGLSGRHQGGNAAAALAGVLTFCERSGLAAPDPWQASSAPATAQRNAMHSSCVMGACVAELMPRHTFNNICISTPIILTQPPGCDLRCASTSLASAPSPSQHAQQRASSNARLFVHTDNIVGQIHESLRCHSTPLGV